YDFIIIETVGVGQSEISVHQMTDFFLLLMLAGAGDELQGIKRGIMEMADSIAITKADGANIQKAKNARTEYAHAIHLFPPTDSGWIPKVSTCSSLTGEGIPDLYTTIQEYRRMAVSGGYFAHKRAVQQQQWLHQSISSYILDNFYSDKNVQAELKKAENELSASPKNPYNLAARLVKKWRS
ncbi:MAG: methylmalonyl Co-A mutase-associated GTPase MeaB, partial [Bacteroidia bacterium]